MKNTGKFTKRGGGNLSSFNLSAFYLSPFKSNVILNFTKRTKNFVILNLIQNLKNFCVSLYAQMRSIQKLQDLFSNRFRLGGRNDRNCNELIYLSTYQLIHLQKSAFTLAEVLITLGIIGVVAAMTIPILFNKCFEIIAVNRMKTNVLMILEVVFLLLHLRIINLDIMILIRPLMVLQII